MNLDVIIVGRGGGSIEDLWAFNEAIVAEAIFNAHTPIISAVGHETDFTIADFVADRRAPTPSAAAELAVADINIIEERIEGYRLVLFSAMNKLVDEKRHIADTYAMRLKYLNPISQINEKRIYLDRQKDRMDVCFNEILKNSRHKLEVYASKLHGLSPLIKLGQGYSFTENADGRNVSSVKDAKVGDALKITVTDGVINAKVESVSENMI
jgi:exodeoxyribonuclease VII large subunit